MNNTTEASFTVVSDEYRNPNRPLLEARLTEGAKIRYVDTGYRRDPAQRNKVRTGTVKQVLKEGYGVLVGNNPVALKDILEVVG